MTVYVLTLDGYVQGVFRNLAALHRATDKTLNPSSLLVGADCKRRRWSKWNLQQAFRETACGYVTLVAEGGIMYEITKKGIVK